MTFAYSATRSIVHDENWRPLINEELEYAHDIRMSETRKRLALSKELFYILFFKRGMQHFECCLTFQVEMFPQVHFCESASSKQTQKTIVAELVSDMVGQAYTSP